MVYPLAELFPLTPWCCCGCLEDQVQSLHYLFDRVKGINKILGVKQIYNFFKIKK